MKTINIPKPPFPPSQEISEFTGQETKASKEKYKEYEKECEVWEKEMLSARLDEIEKRLDNIEKNYKRKPQIRGSAYDLSTRNKRFGERKR